MTELASEHEFVNWYGNEKCRPQHYYQPASVDEVCTIVRRVAAEGGVLRVAGAGHSWSPLVPTRGTIINLDRHNRVLAVDTVRQQVTVQAGIRIKDLNAELDRHGLALANLGSITEQSIAGAISTGTHGTGLRLGNMSTQIVGMQLVSGAGQLHELTLGGQPELLRAARVSLGALGVVTQVTIQCVPKFNVHLRAEHHPFEETLAWLGELNERHDRVRLYWFPDRDDVYVMTYDHTDAPATPQNQVLEWFERHVALPAIAEVMLGLGRLVPDLLDGLNSFSDLVGLGAQDSIRPSYDALTLPFMPPRHNECEYALPIERAAEGLRATRALIEQHGAHVDFPIEVRFAAADDSLLSPAHGRASCYIGAYTAGDTFALPLYAAFEPPMKALGGRPHWGKYFTYSAAEARASYPEYAQFAAIRRQLDPAGTFANQLIRDLFV